MDRRNQPERAHHILPAQAFNGSGQRPLPVRETDENLMAGAEIYAQMCAKCHGTPHAGPSLYGASFYPPAPQLATRPPDYTEAELFWIIRHGIRNTAMPAWGGQLSDENIWQAVTFLKRLDSLPPTITADQEKDQRGAAGQ